MTYPSSPGAEDSRRPGSEGAVAPGDPAGYQQYPGYKSTPDYTGYGYQQQPYPYQAYPYQAGYPTPYGYGDPYAQMGYAAWPRPYDGMAIASLVVSCVAALGLCFYGVGGLIGVVGAILGHVSRRRIRQSGAQGDGLALAGVIVGWIAAALALIIVAFWVVMIVVSLNSPDMSSSTT